VNVSAIISAGGVIPSEGAASFSLKNSTGVVVATASGSVTGGSAGTTLGTANLPIGTYTLAASYGGGANFNSSQTATSASIWIQYRWDGFLQPINDTAHTQATMSVFKSGSTVPVKFQLKDATGAAVQAAAVPLWVTPVKTGTMTQPVDEQVYTDPPTSGQTFRWDGSQYVYNWQSPKDPGGLYRLCAKFDDGQTQCVNIGLK